MAEVSANCGEQAADIGRNALSHVKKITETTGLPKCSRFLEVPQRRLPSMSPPVGLFR